jgi:hypothetical protein
MSQKSRYIPSPEIHNLKTQLQLSQIESKRGYLNSQGYNNLPSDESPFNPIIYSDVQYSEPSLSKTNRCLTKYENKSPNMNDIALYDTRIYDLNAQNVPELADNVLHKNQMERARSKIQYSQSNAGIIPSFGSSSTNGIYYNPNLPISETNKPPPNMKPTLMDERMTYYTNERPWNYESDRANMAYDLQRSPEILERNRRQQEADDALFRRHKKNRWVEPKMAYMNRMYDPTYSIDEFTKKQAEKDNERSTLSPIHAKEAFAKTRVGFDETDINHLNKEIYGTFQPEYSRKMNEIYDRESLKSRMEQFSPDDQSSQSSQPAPKGSFVNTASYITDTIKSFFPWNNHGSKSPPIKSKDENITYDEDGSVTYSNERYNVPTASEVNTSFNSGTERFFYKPDHMLIVRNGEVPEIFPDENHDYTAVSFVQADPLNTGLIRTIVIKDDSKFKIIQKRNEDAIFSGDNRPYGEDFISIEIPVDIVDDKIRDRIKKFNMDTKRDKVIELTYDDFIAFSDFVVEHPEVQQRLKYADLHRRVRANKYDADIITNFEGKKTFVDDKVYAVISDNIRKKQIKSNTGRIDKEQNPTVEGYSTSSPLFSSQSPASNSHSYRNVQLNDTQFATNRSRNVQLSKFNV